MRTFLKCVALGTALLLATTAAFANGSSEQGNGGATDGKVYTMKFGHDQMESAPHHVAAVKFKELVEERTGGHVQVQLFPAQQLGTSREMIEGLQIGTVEGVALPSAAFSGFDLSSGLIDLPFMFPSPEVAWKVLDGPVGDQILASLDKVGITGASFWTSGFKAFTGSFPIHKPSDFKGKKIRVMSNPVLIAQYESMGASAIPIDFNELYNALQQNAVDGEENPLSTIVNMKFYEVQHYITLSNHGMLGYIVAFSKSWLQSLPQEYRDIVIQAAKEVAPFERSEILRLETEKYLPTITAFGCQVDTLTDADRKAFEEVTRPTYDIYAKQLDDQGKELLKALQEAVAASSK